jgi:photosystem II stability/assembly factor-like uncharacterized protein
MSLTATRRRYFGAATLLSGIVLELGFASCATTGGSVGQVDEGDGASPGIMLDAGDGSCDSDSNPCPVAQEIACDGFDWCPAKIGQPIDVGLTSVWGTGPDDVWAVGAAGTVIHWDGYEWTVLPRLTDWLLSAVWGTGQENVWTVSSPNKIFHTNGRINGTVSWSPLPPIASDEGIHGSAIHGSERSLLRALWAQSPVNLWVGGEPFCTRWPDTNYWESGWRSMATDGGFDWAPLFQATVLRDVPIIHAIWAAWPDDIWVVGVGNVGEHNTPFAAHTSAAAIEGSDPPIWIKVDTQSNAFFYALWGSGPNDVWAIGDYGTIRHITGGADAWTVVESPTKEHLRGIWGSAPDDIWAVGRHGTLLHYDGVKWESQTGAFPLGDPPNLYGVWASDSTNVWAVGDGIIMRYAGPRTRGQ